MKWNYNDGGRSQYFKGSTRDCVTRAIAIATGKDYKEVYDRLKQLCKESTKYKEEAGKLVRDGTPIPIVKKYLEDELGWKWVSTINTKTKERMHLVEEEIPNGTFIARLTKHLVCVKDKVIEDTWNCSEKTYYDEYGDLQVNDSRMIYGYWIAPTKEELEEKQYVKEQTAKMKELQKASLEQTKKKIKKVKTPYEKKIHKLELQIKKLKREMEKEVKAIKEQGSKELQDKILNLNEKAH